MTRLILAGFISITQLLPAVAYATDEDLRWHLGVEAGPVWQSRNDVLIIK